MLILVELALGTLPTEISFLCINKIKTYAMSPYNYKDANKKFTIKTTIFSILCVHVCVCSTFPVRKVLH